MIIAIDGPAASGKGTLAKRIGAHFGFPVLDTGLLYRAVARDVVKGGAALDDTTAALEAAQRLDLGTFDDPALRGAEAGDAASI
ncbi:(d)CMP kinase, partial [Klebsiella pneumoniae]|nr:(d)CMP kinase [Klebsiella pneumoniae]